MLDRSLLFVGRERTLFSQHSHRDAVFVEFAFRNYDEILRWIRHPKFVQSLHGNGDHAEGLARLVKLPASDGDQAVGPQVLEVFLERFDGIEIVLAQRECACGGGGPGIHQRHLQDVELLAGVAYERAAIGDLDMDIRALVQVLCVIRVAAAHDGIGDDGIDLDSSDAVAAIGDRPQNVDPSTRPDDGVVAVRAEHICQRRRRRHQIVLPGSLPVGGVGVHDVGGSVRINHNGLRATLTVDFDARKRVPAGKFDPGLIPEIAFGVDHVKQAAGMIGGKQQTQGQGNDCCQRFAVDRPDQRRQRCDGPCEQNHVRPAEEVQQRNHCQTSHGSPQQIGSVKPSNVSGFTGKENRKGHPCEEKRDGGREINQGQPEEIRPLDVQRDRGAKRQFQDDRNDQCVQQAQPRKQGPGGVTGEPRFAQISKNSARSQAQQRD